MKCQNHPQNEWIFWQGCIGCPQTQMIRQNSGLRSSNFDQCLFQERQRVPVFPTLSRSREWWIPQLESDWWGKIPRNSEHHLKTRDTWILCTKEKDIEATTTCSEKQMWGLPNATSTAPTIMRKMVPIPTREEINRKVCKTEQLNN